jgi:hypothetical protein
VSRFAGYLGLRHWANGFKVAEPDLRDAVNADRGMEHRHWRGAAVELSSAMMVAMA